MWYFFVLTTFWRHLRSIMRVHTHTHAHTRQTEAAHLILKKQCLFRWKGIYVPRRSREWWFDYYAPRNVRTDHIPTSERLVFWDKSWLGGSCGVSLEPQPCSYYLTKTSFIHGVYGEHKIRIKIFRGRGGKSFFKKQKIIIKPRLNVPLVFLDDFFRY